MESIYLGRQVSFQYTELDDYRIDRIRSLEITDEMLVPAKEKVGDNPELVIQELQVREDVQNTMKLRNVLIVVNDIEKSKEFYKELFGLEVILDNDGNVILTEGLVLQDAKIWQQCIQKDIIPKNNATELYFEETNIEAFAEKLRNYGAPITYVNELMEHSWGQKVIRFYDLDGNLIEVGTPM